MGGVRNYDKKRLNFVIKKGDANTFYEQIKSLNTLLIEKWGEQENLREIFVTSGVKFMIILDNASYHKKKDILMKTSAEMPPIVLEFLPSYSPDYNLIELGLHSLRDATRTAKEYIAHRLFESVEQLLHKLLNVRVASRIGKENL